MRREKTAMKKISSPKPILPLPPNPPPTPNPTNGIIKNFLINNNNYYSYYHCCAQDLIFPFHHRHTLNNPSSIAPILSQHFEVPIPISPHLLFDCVMLVYAEYVCLYS
ncbi:hypothetical protein CsSME_00006939 [Camellia sinensis var. sinensis]